MNKHVNVWVGHWFLYGEVKPNTYNAVHKYYLNDWKNYIQQIEIYPDNTHNLIGIPTKNLNLFMGGIIKHDDCFEWNKSYTNDGYGQTTVHYKNWRTHRLSYSLFYGPIPDGLLVCHSCDNKKCLNPLHLFVGTVKDNALDASKKGLICGELSSSNILTEELIWKLCDEIINTNSTIFELATKFDISHHTIRDLLKAKTWKQFMPKVLDFYNFSYSDLKKQIINDFTGEKHIHSKLNIDKVKQIKRLLLNNYSRQHIAIKFGVSVPSIRNIDIGKTWSYVTI